jgi:hypothetical protein
MPRATDRLAHHDPLGERAAIVGAVGADGEDLLPPPHHEHRLAAAVPEELAAVRQLGEGDALRQIGS